MTRDEAIRMVDYTLTRSATVRLDLKRLLLRVQELDAAPARNSYVKPTVKKLKRELLGKAALGMASLSVSNAEAVRWSYRHTEVCEELSEWGMLTGEILQFTGDIRVDDPDAN